MHTYMVVAAKDETVTEKFTPDNCIQFQPGAWFVRSGLTTCSEVAALLGFSEGSQRATGVVVAAKFLSGYGSSAVSETLQGWRA